MQSDVLPSQRLHLFAHHRSSSTYSIISPTLSPSKAHLQNSQTTADRSNDGIKVSLIWDSTIHCRHVRFCSAFILNPAASSLIIDTFPCLSLLSHRLHLVSPCKEGRSRNCENRWPLEVIGLRHVYQGVLAIRRRIWRVLCRSSNCLHSGWAEQLIAADRSGMKGERLHLLARHPELSPIPRPPELR